jgi:hypothetical protein
VRFIASLSRVDGFVLLDKSLVVHGFGVDVVSTTDLLIVQKTRQPVQRIEK